MAGLGRVVVGYRKDDPRRATIQREHGYASLVTTHCAAGCGYPVYFVRSGYDAARYRDAQPICDQCYQRYRHDVQADL